MCLGIHSETDFKNFDFFHLHFDFGQSMKEFCKFCTEVGRNKNCC